MLTALSRMTMARWTALAVFSLAVVLLVMPAPAGWQPEVLRGAASTPFSRASRKRCEHMPLTRTLR